MQLSEEGYKLIKHYEGLRLKSYLCAAGVLTIGYGHTGKVKKNEVITIEQADILLRQDVRESEAVVNSVVKVPMTQGQFDALTSFVFNLGSGAFKASSLLKKLNRGDYDGAVKEFSRWVFAGNKKLPGLVKRREAEQGLFLTGEFKAV